MGAAWSVRSRLTLKRQKLRREEGRLYMPVLGQIIREIEREAASLSTAELRHEIEINLEVQDAAIRQYYAGRPEGGRPDHGEQRGHGLRHHNRPVRQGTG